MAMATSTSIAGKLHAEAAGARSAMTETELTDDCRLGVDVITDFDATGRALLAPAKDRLAEGGNAMDNALCEITSPGKSASVEPSILSARQVVEMPGTVATVKQPVACLAVSSDSGISAYSKRGTKPMGVCQVLIFLLIIRASSKQAISSAEAKTESEEIGSCRFDLTSIATLSCVEPDGNGRPPSVSCCKALLYAIDNLPAGNESGACCLCRYLSKKYSTHGLALATSYVLCQGKDSHIVTAWSSLPLYCYKVCRRQGNASAYGMGTTVVKDFPDLGAKGTDSDYFKMLLWLAIIGAAAFCIMILVRFWRHTPIPLNLQNQGLPSEVRDDERRASGKKLSAHRRMSPSRGSPNG